MKNKMILYGCISFVVVIGIWFIGGTAFRWSLEPFAGIFGSNDTLENTFAPVGAFFSAVAAGATFFLICWQFQEAVKREEEFKSQQFESIFFQLISVHRDNVRSIRYEEQIPKKGIHHLHQNEVAIYNGQCAFHKFYELFWHCCWSISPEGLIQPAIQELTIAPDWIRATDEASEGSERLNSDDILKRAEQILNAKINECLSLYYHNVYIILKYIAEELETKEERRKYLRIFRAQISVFEYVMIYYHAATHKNEDEEYKFKELIENTGFLHNLDKQYIFDLNKEGFPNITRYHCSAFQS